MLLSPEVSLRLLVVWGMVVTTIPHTPLRYLQLETENLTIEDIEIFGGECA